MRELRLARGYSQELVGVALTLGQSGYGDLETGATVVKRGDLVALATLYRLPLSEAFPTYIDPLADLPEFAEAA